MAIDQEPFSAQMTYQSLLQNIQDYSERPDPIFLNNRPNFILFAEQQIAADFKNLLQIRNVTGTLDNTSNGVLQKPSRWRKMVSFSVNGTVLTHRTQEYIQMIVNEMPMGQPLHYADIDYKYLSVAPLPNVAMPFFMIYEERVQPLSEQNSTNLYTSEAPQLLLAQTMLQASVFLKNERYIGFWSNQYNTAVQALRSEDQNRLVDRNTAVTSNY